MGTFEIVFYVSIASAVREHTCSPHFPGTQDSNMQGCFHRCFEETNGTWEVGPPGEILLRKNLSRSGRG